MRRKGDKDVSDTEIGRYLYLTRELGWTKAASAREIGRSKSWAYGMEDRLGLKVAHKVGSNPAAPKLKEIEPNPKSFLELDGGVKDTLADFLLFRRTFFLRDEQPWAKIAADRTVEALLDKSERTFIVENVFPGAGKTTIKRDIFFWLICGGGSLDPAFGRALRLMWGQWTKHGAIHNVQLLKRTFEDRKPFYDKTKKARADISLVDAFGRFRPKPSEGEDQVWRRDQFTVAQMTEIGLYEKEPTVQAASKEAGFLGERVDLAVWDDLVVSENAINAERSAQLAVWFEQEAETRIEPGGVLILVGQRLTPMDLYRNRLDVTYHDFQGQERKTYKHIVFPAHLTQFCSNGGELAETCSQWDGKTRGCLLDEGRLSLNDHLVKLGQSSYATTHQQEDADPEAVLVRKVWLSGGTDDDGFPAPGCYDFDRGFLEWPKGQLIDYMTVDPAAGKWWGLEWWALDPVSRHSYLIYGDRRKMKAGLSEGFLDWDPDQQRLVGFMQEFQEKSGALGHPILAWIVEANAAHKYLRETFAHQKFRRTWPQVEVWPHISGKNKIDEKYGIDSVSIKYKTGYARLPRKHGDLKALNFVNQLTNELTNYPFYPTTDLVMANWFGVFNEERIAKLADKFQRVAMNVPPKGVPRAVAKRMSRFGS